MTGIPEMKDRLDKREAQLTLQYYWIRKELDDHHIKDKCHQCAGAAWWDGYCKKAQDLREEMLYLKSVLALIGGENDE